MKLREELEKIIIQRVSLSDAIDQIEELFIKIVKESKPDQEEMYRKGIHQSEAANIYEKNLLEAIKSE